MKTRPKCVFNATVFLHKHAKWWSPHQFYCKSNFRFWASVFVLQSARFLPHVKFNVYLKFVVGEKLPDILDKHNGARWVFMAQEQCDNREYSGCFKGRSGDSCYLGGWSPVVCDPFLVRSSNHGNGKVALMLSSGELNMLWYDGCLTYMD